MAHPGIEHHTHNTKGKNIMAAKLRIEELNRFRIGRNKNVNEVKIADDLSRREPLWRSYNEEARMAMVRDAKSKAAAEYAAKLSDIRARITTEAKEVKSGTGKIKYPLRSSGEAALRAVGTQQQTNALLFLSGTPNVERIAAEVADALDRGEVDYAFTIMENCLNTVTKDISGKPILTEAQKILQANITAIYSAFDGSAKIGELENESKLYDMAASIADDFRHQEERGAAVLLSPELLPYISEAEREEAVTQAMAGNNLTDKVNFKRRAQEAMQRSTLLNV